MYFGSPFLAKNWPICEQYWVSSQFSIASRRFRQVLEHFPYPPGIQAPKPVGAATNCARKFTDLRTARHQKFVPYQDKKFERQENCLLFGPKIIRSKYLSLHLRIALRFIVLLKWPYNRPMRMFRCNFVFFCYDVI